MVYRRMHMLDATYILCKNMHSTNNEKFENVRGILSPQVNKGGEARVHTQRQSTNKGCPVIVCSLLSFTQLLSMYLPILLPVEGNTSSF
jgi:hypothetical protein